MLSGKSEGTLTGQATNQVCDLNEYMQDCLPTETCRHGFKSNGDWDYNTGIRCRNKRGVGSNCFTWQDCSSGSCVEGKCKENNLVGSANTAENSVPQQSSSCPAGKVEVDSHVLPDEQGKKNSGQISHRAGCCDPSQCITSQGDCFVQSAIFGGDNQFLCYADSDWERCDDARIGIINRVGGATAECTKDGWVQKEWYGEYCEDTYCAGDLRCEWCTASVQDCRANRCSYQFEAHLEKDTNLDHAGREVLGLRCTGLEEDMLYFHDLWEGPEWYTYHNHVIHYRNTKPSRLLEANSGRPGDSLLDYSDNDPKGWQNHKYHVDRGSLLPGEESAFFTITGNPAISGEREIRLFTEKRIGGLKETVYSCEICKAGECFNDEFQLPKFEGQSCGPAHICDFGLTCSGSICVSE